jgi:hypothetical protein
MFPLDPGQAGAPPSLNIHYATSWKLESWKLGSKNFHIIQKLESWKTLYQNFPITTILGSWNSN